MRPERRPHARARLQQGVGLIEVLIAVLVMAIGLLGIAAMQATAMKNSQSALERSQAVVQSYAILDAMRANLTLARSGVYHMDSMMCDAPELADPSDPASLDFNDKVAWIQSLHAELGEQACGQIHCPPGAADEPRLCTVTVRWNDSRGTEGNPEQPIQVVTRI